MVGVSELTFFFFFIEFEVSSGKRDLSLNTTVFCSIFFLTSMPFFWGFKRVLHGSLVRNWEFTISCVLGKDTKMRKNNLETIIELLVC